METAFFVIVYAFWIVSIAILVTFYAGKVTIWRILRREDRRVAKAAREMIAAFERRRRR